MAAPGKTVYVLGAGFTRAFVPSAPLLVDYFDVPELIDLFGALESAEAVLQSALAERGDGKVDLEKLMTRLTGLPYDDADALREFAILTAELKKRLVAKLAEAKAFRVDTPGLHAFARLVLDENASIVSFNYDDILDEALYLVALGIDGGRQTWHPDGGYGFYCRPSLITVADSTIFMNVCRSLLLKLHGSLNWRSPLGEPSARSPAGVCHHEGWFTEMGPGLGLPVDILALRETYLEPDPLIVPPLLVKSELALHPVLRLVWNRARAKLADAESVVFIGYSLPLTDLASRTLFEETLVNRKDCEIHVVNKAESHPEKLIIELAYTRLFGSGKLKFDFSGARDWLRRVAPDDPANKPAPPAAPSAGSGAAHE